MSRRTGARLRIDSTVIVLGILLLALVVGAILVATVGRNFLSPGNIQIGRAHV